MIEREIEKNILQKFENLLREVNNVFFIFKEKGENEETNYYLKVNDEKIKIENDFNLLNLIKESIYKIKKRKSIKNKKIAFLIDDFSEGITFSIIIVDLSRTLLEEKVIKLIKSEYLPILEKIIEICEEIREEGREGRKIGTWFVIGDYEKLKDYCKQLILNPFKGYLKEELNILKNDLKETIKELAQLDGCFVVDKDGCLISAGTYIDINTENIKRYMGWGTKHLTAAALTKEVEDCIAVVLSESGGKIKVFKDGRIIFKK